MCRCQSSDHDDPDRQTIPQSHKANIAIDTRQRLRSTLARLAVSVQLRDHDVGGVRNGGRADTRDVAAEERDAGLLVDVERVLGLAHRLVDVLDRLLERRELHHRVRDLPAPERVQPFVQPARRGSSAFGQRKRNERMSVPGYAFFGHDARPALAQVFRVRRYRRLHAHLDSFPRAEGHVGKELGAGRRTQVHERSVHVREQLVAVPVFEHLVEPIFARALEAVADEGGRPPEEYTAQPVSPIYFCPALDIRLVNVRVYLASGFDHIERSHESVGWSACWWLC